MTYTIKRYESTYNPGIKADITVGDLTINQSSTSLSLVGQFAEPYVQEVGNNYFWLGENFAGTATPANALPGQLWWNTSSKELLIYEGVSALEDGDSTDLSLWLPVVGNIDETLDNHTSQTGNDNPHKVTVEQVNLENLINQPTLTQSNNLSELISTNSTARANIDVYSRDDVYTKTESDLLFYDKTGTPTDTLKLGGLSQPEYVKENSPIINDTLDINALTDGIFYEMNRYNSFSNKNGTEGFSINSGVTPDGNSLGTLNSGVRTVMHTNQTTPKLEVKIYPFANEGEFSTPDATMLLNETTLYYNNNSVYYTGNAPTPNEIGAYNAGDTVADAAALDGKVLSKGPTPNTVVLRTNKEESGDGRDIKANNFLPTQATNTAPLVDSTVIGARNTDSTEIIFAPKFLFEAALRGGTPEGVRYWGAHDMTLGAGGTINRNDFCTISYLGTGRIQVYMSPSYRLPEDTNYTVVLGSLDDGSINSGIWFDSYQSLFKVSAFITNKTTSSFVINVKATYNTAPSNRQTWGEGFSGVLANHSYVTFAVFYEG